MNANFDQALFHLAQLYPECPAALWADVRKLCPTADSFAEKRAEAERAMVALFETSSGAPLFERLAAVEALLEQLDRARTALEDEALNRKPRCAAFVAMDEQCGEPLPCPYHTKT